MTKRAFEKTKNILATIALIVTLLSGGITFSWCKIIKPEIGKQISEEQRPIMDELFKIKGKIEFQTYLLTGNMSPGAYDSAIVRWNRIKPESKK